MQLQPVMSSASEKSALEKATIRKVALRTVPFLMLCYFIACVDRVNAGFAEPMAQGALDRPAAIAWR